MNPVMLLYRNKDGQSCTVTVELDGKAPGLPTGATHTRRVPGHCTPAVLITRKGNRLPYYYKPCAVKVAQSHRLVKYMVLCLSARVSRGFSPHPTVIKKKDHAEQLPAPIAASNST